MKTEKRVTRNTPKYKFATYVITKICLFVLSIFQSIWIPVACAAGVMAAATMFGDKGYMRNFVGEADSLSKRGEPNGAIKLLESKISECLQSKPQDTNTNEKYLPDLYFQLAKTKEKVGASEKDVIEIYKKSVFSNKGGNALVWLYTHLNAQEYKELVKDYVHSKLDHSPKGYIQDVIVKQFEETRNWLSFKTFIEIVFDENERPIEYARVFGSALCKNGSWIKEYMDYCKTRPNLLQYFIEYAKEQVDQGNYKKALEVIYAGEEMLKSGWAEKDTSQFKLDICQMLFNAGEYKQAALRVDSFVEEYKSTHRALVKEATLLKGQIHIQLGEIDKALEGFLTLLIEYPEAQQTPDVSFYIGYCYMLQGKFDKAKDALNTVIKDYPPK